MKKFKTETDFAKYITKELRKCRAQVLSIVGHRMQASAWPDLYVSHPLYHGFIELKGEKTVLRADQKEQMRLIHETEGYAAVVRNPNRVENLDGELLATFDQTGIGLLRVLWSLANG